MKGRNRSIVCRREGNWKSLKQIKGILSENSKSNCLDNNNWLLSKRRKRKKRDKRKMLGLNGIWNNKTEYFLNNKKNNRDYSWSNKKGRERNRNIFINNS